LAGVDDSDFAAVSLFVSVFDVSLDEASDVLDLSSFDLGDAPSDLPFCA
jgi:hypothetical protein